MDFLGTASNNIILHSYLNYVTLIQVAASKAKKNGVRWHPLFVRWHPLFVRWCLNIMLTSSKTYEILKDSGFIYLPSQRTLKDYTHWTKLKPGFNADVFNFLKGEAKVDKTDDG